MFDFEPPIISKVYWMTCCDKSIIGVGTGGFKDRHNIMGIENWGLHIFVG